MEKNINKQTLFSSFLKNQAYKIKKIFNISYLIMVLIKTRLLIFLVLSRHELACKYRIISQISIYNSIKNCIFWYFWYCIFIFLRSNYNSNCCDKSDGLSHHELRAVAPAQIATFHRTSSGRQLKQKKKRWIKIEFWSIPELMVHLGHD